MPRTNENKERLNISLTIDSLKYLKDELSKANFKPDDFENYYAADKKNADYGDKEKNEKVRMFVDTLLDLRKMHNEEQSSIGVPEWVEEKYNDFFGDLRKSETMTAFHKVVRNTMLEFAANEATLSDKEKLKKLWEYDELLSDMTGDQLRKAIKNSSQATADKAFQTIVRNSADNYLYDTAISLKRAGHGSPVYFQQYLEQSRRMEKIKNDRIDAGNEDEKNKIDSFFKEKSEAEVNRILENEEKSVKIDLEKEAIQSEKEKDQKTAKAQFEMVEQTIDHMLKVNQRDLEKRYAAEMSKRENEIYALCDKLEKNFSNLQTTGRKDTSQEYNNMITGFENLKKSRFINAQFDRGKVEASIRDNMCLDGDGNSVFGWNDSFVDTFGLNIYIDKAVNAANAYRTKKEQGALSDRIKSSFFNGKQRYQGAVEMENDLKELKQKLNDYNKWKKDNLESGKFFSDDYHQSKRRYNNKERIRLDAKLNLKREDDLIAEKNDEYAKLKKEKDVSLTRLDRYVKADENDKTRTKTSIQEMRRNLDEKINTKRKEAKEKYAGKKDLSWKVKVEPKKQEKAK